MRRTAAWAAAIAGALALAACDEPGSPKGSASRAFDSTAPENIPEPARFAKPGPPPAEIAAKPAVQQLVRASEQSAPETVSSAPPEKLEQVSYNAGRIFEPRAPQPSSAVIAAPRPKTHGARLNSPTPDRVENGALVLENRQFAVDTDGLIADPQRRKQVVAHDRSHRNDTALSIGGKYLDSTVVPYISIPMDFKGARVGDLARVCVGGYRCAWAVVGDVGPAGRFGEGSVALAEKLGLNADGNSGGASRGVNYRIFPGQRMPQGNQAQLVAYLDSRGGSLPGSVVVAAR